jgi:hypothetical protein
VLFLHENMSVSGIIYIDIIMLLQNKGTQL